MRLPYKTACAVVALGAGLLLTAPFVVAAAACVVMLDVYADKLWPRRCDNIAAGFAA